MQGMLENTFMNVKNRSSKITADLEIPAGGANGAILSQGGRFGGWSLFMKDGKPGYTYNFLGLARYTVVTPQRYRLVPPRSFSTSPMTAVASERCGDPLRTGACRRAQGEINPPPPAETADVGTDNQTLVAEASASARDALHRR
jgi:arylsulfatase